MLIKNKLFIFIKNNKTMAVRNQHTRKSSNSVDFLISGIYLTLLPKDCSVSKSYLYSVKKKILDSKILLPSIETKINQPFLLCYCSKEGVDFVWN